MPKRAALLLGLLLGGSACMAPVRFALESDLARAQVLRSEGKQLEGLALLEDIRRRAVAGHQLDLGPGR